MISCGKILIANEHLLPIVLVWEQGFCLFVELFPSTGVLWVIGVRLHANCLYISILKTCVFVPTPNSPIRCYIIRSSYHGWFFGDKNSHICVYPLLMLLSSVRAAFVGCHLSCWHLKGFVSISECSQPYFMVGDWFGVIFSTWNSCLQSIYLQISWVLEEYLYPSFTVFNFQTISQWKVSYHTCGANRVVTSQYALQLQGCLTLARIWIVDCEAIQSEKFHLCGWPQVSCFLSTPKLSILSLEYSQTCVQHNLLLYMT